MSLLSILGMVFLFLLGAIAQREFLILEKLGFHQVLSWKGFKEDFNHGTKA